MAAEIILTNIVNDCKFDNNCKFGKKVDKWREFKEMI